MRPVIDVSPGKEKNRAPIKVVVMKVSMKRMIFSSGLFFPGFRGVSFSGAEITDLRLNP
jgi:hypothetical protein